MNLGDDDDAKWQFRLVAVQLFDSVPLLRDVRWSHSQSRTRIHAVDQDEMGRDVLH